MFGIVESEKWGLDDGRVWALVAVGAVLVGALVKRSRHHPEPVLDLALLSYRSFSATCAGIVFYGFAFTSGALVNSIALQDLWDQPLSTVGLAFVPGPLLAAVISPLSGSVADRLGHRWVLGAGCLMCAAGATTNTVRQAAYALGISVTITLLATGVDASDLSAYRWAWAWIAACFTLAGVVVMALFPAGNSEERLRPE